LRVVVGQSSVFVLKRADELLDEAQHIKNRTTKAAKAAVALKAKYRWCLTGYVFAS
jgi:hypothetical protein